MKKILFISLLCIAAILFSCDKNNDSPRQTNTVIGQWNLLKAVYVDVTTNVASTDTFDTGSYLRFDDNDTCYSHVDRQDYASHWNFIDNNTAIFIDKSSGFDVNDSGYVIQKLTSDSLILFSKELIDNAKQTLYLSK